MLVDRTLVARDAPHVQVIAREFSMSPILASAWTEMTLAQPHGVETVHATLERCVHHADACGDSKEAAEYRTALRGFDSLASHGLAPPSAARTAERKADRDAGKAVILRIDPRLMAGPVGTSGQTPAKDPGARLH